MIVSQDLFAEAREKITVFDAWKMLGFDGEPKASCKSPFREDRSPSFSIFEGGKAWTDHASGDGGDVVEFIRHAIGGDHKDVREWLQERIGSHQPSPRPIAAPANAKAIKWPSPLVMGDSSTWQGFADKRGLTYPAVYTMAQLGLLRFTKLPDGVKCYVVTDTSNRCAEIRRLDGQLFETSKVYPLQGVDKSWLPGLELLRDAPQETGVLITEGATDLLSAIDIFSRYRRNHGGLESWQPVALLGAGCKKLNEDAIKLIKGRHVRLVPDGDAAGDGMADHWTGLLRKIGCHVDVVSLERGSDLTHHLSTISPTNFFSK